MSGKKTLCTLVAILLFGVSSLQARDTATFVDLGFSPDGRTFMFAQYGVQAGTLRPWADLLVVDVPRNDFVVGGRVSYVHHQPVVFGQDGSGTLRDLLMRNVPLVERHGINHSVQGRPLYIALDNVAPNVIEFRNFETGAFYRASLVQTIEGTGANLRSSFIINLQRDARDGTRRTLVVGTPSVRRPLITSYRIRQARVFGDSMIFVIEMTRQEGSSVAIRYMVEAVRF
jgi:predicted secreted protein